MLHPVKPRPFKLLTAERGQMKKQELLGRLKKLLEEEERLRVRPAQELPGTTEHPEILQKPPVKESTKPLDIRLNSGIRAVERAEFDRLVADKLLIIEEERLEQERLRKAAEEEEIKRLRREMVPKAQSMPNFDRPFQPRRSTKRLTIPREPQFHRPNKRQKSASPMEHY
ncbi:hypothetical protein KP509_02G078000 [Ceratopteris richardii]|uniref:TPX2 C-terminal domain-containing protein n=1 Tax=Ceratopteris richardii TaxID=49495 RepID=A0A8T2V7L3_CERRI|nr:hypothetical protein KP509_02G078000 [Ceratopteris richardii]